MLKCPEREGEYRGIQESEPYYCEDCGALKREHVEVEDADPADNA